MSGGAGTAYAGAGPAGLDPVAAFSAPGKNVPIPGTQVALFDIGSRTVVRDSTTGLVKRIHWVDQAVALALGVTNGKLTSQSSLGNKMRLIKRNDRVRLEAEVQDAVRVALSSLISRKDINVSDVQVAQPVPSQIVVVVWYVNLRNSNLTSPVTPSNFAFAV